MTIFNEVKDFATLDHHSCIIHWLARINDYSPWPGSSQTSHSLFIHESAHFNHFLYFVGLCEL